MLNRPVAILVLSSAITASAVEPASAPGRPRLAFKQHAINAESKFEGAGALDVNRDGKLDILCGSYWYEAPDWKKHFVREVKEQDHYHHDFCDLPMDVDEDGWTDVLTCAWHNKRVSWVRNPGQRRDEQQPWEEISIDEPGNMETAMLADVNNDGRPDMLPNVAQKAIWYEWQKDASGPHGIKWRPHELPRELAGHGLGAGDLNGDGRTDLIGPRGWLEQREKNKWQWHPEFELGAASIPVVVTDVDGDHDADIVWGMGHDYGFYWLEQEKDAAGARVWSRHQIDKSWSQAHVVLAADLDADGRLEIFTGKRFYAHDTDTGANDPRCLYWYAFDRRARRWSRHVIQEGGGAGTGTSSEIVDMDRDGDLDLLCPGKSGLYLLENLLK